MENKALINYTLKAMQKAYAPYSRYKVGAVLLTGDGKLFSGCNIENASYGLTLCAERVAIFKAISERQRNFLKLVVVADDNKIPMPCGACLQVIAEFAPKITLVLVNKRGEFREYKLSDLLPHPFKLTR